MTELVKARKEPYIESMEETEHRRKISRLAMTAKRASIISVEHAIDAFYI